MATEKDGSLKRMEIPRWNFEMGAMEDDSRSIVQRKVAQTVVGFRSEPGLRAPAKIVELHSEQAAENCVILSEAKNLSIDLNRREILRSLR